MLERLWKIVSKYDSTIATSQAESEGERQTNATMCIGLLLVYLVCYKAYAYIQPTGCRLFFFNDERFSNEFPLSVPLPLISGYRKDSRQTWRYCHLHSAMRVLCLVFVAAFLLVCNKIECIQRHMHSLFFFFSLIKHFALIGVYDGRFWI